MILYKYRRDCTGHQIMLNICRNGLQQFLQFKCNLRKFTIFYKLPEHLNILERNHAELE